jgi:pyruvate kinase
MAIVDASDLLAINSVIKLGADFIAVPLVESKEDIMEVRDLLSVKGRHIKLLAKIQNRNAV